MALTNKERQRRYRLRHNGFSVRLTPSEIAWVLASLKLHLNKEPESHLHDLGLKIFQKIHDKIDEQTAERKTL
mgnify:CR=1 FL=1